MRHLKTLVSAILVALVVVAAVDYTASAATGRPFLLGKLNKANQQTTLKRTTPGTALKVVTKSAGNAPFAVNGTGTVTNLSADKIDGIDSSALGTRSYVWRMAVSHLSSAQYRLPLANGSYLVSYSNYFGTLADNQSAECWVLEHGADSRYTGYSSVRNAPVTGLAWSPALSGSGLVTKTSANEIIVGCNASAQYTTPVDTPLEIVATPTSPVVGPALVPAS
jgi:hypothetical protein